MSGWLKSSAFRTAATATLFAGVTVLVADALNSLGDIPIRPKPEAGHPIGEFAIANPIITVVGVAVVLGFFALGPKAGGVDE